MHYLQRSCQSLRLQQLSIMPRGCCSHLQLLLLALVSAVCLTTLTVANADDGQTCTSQCPCSVSTGPVEASSTPGTCLGGGYPEGVHETASGPLTVTATAALLAQTSAAISSKFPLILSLLTLKCVLKTLVESAQAPLWRKPCLTLPPELLPQRTLLSPRMMAHHMCDMSL